MPPSVCPLLAASAGAVQLLPGPRGISEAKGLDLGLPKVVILCFATPPGNGKSWPAGPARCGRPASPAVAELGDEGLPGPCKHTLHVKLQPRQRWSDSEAREAVSTPDVVEDLDVPPAPADGDNEAGTTPAFAPALQAVTLREARPRERRG